MKMLENRRVVILGLDGVPYELLEDFANSGVMPQMGEIIKKSVFRPMQSSIPEISSVAWSSIITGKNSGEHGIYGFTDFPPNTYRLSFPNFTSLKSPAFWEDNPERKHIILNVPTTFPARPLNGSMISGFVALDLERSVYPQALIPWLKDIDYRVDVDSAKAHQSMDLFLRDLHRTHQARVEAYRHFWNEPWDTFMFVLTGTDRILHFLWDAYEIQGHEYYDALQFTTSFHGRFVCSTWG
jgi:predicted AlkP superfamily phosphohydrolase/phosphomutase